MDGAIGGAKTLRLDLGGYCRRRGAPGSRAAVAGERREMVVLLLLRLQVAGGEADVAADSGDALDYELPSLWSAGGTRLILEDAEGRWRPSCLKSRSAAGVGSFTVAKGLASKVLVAWLKVLILTAEGLDHLQMEELTVAAASGDG
ncbi:hypothetical protein MLD38_018105 [Melastoma candidum]|uniref:Uncharacterized protein n=1 Tax=Melastoma candidum TaxID=119954 RepID=A0ACB9QRX7_9MYRT|nr:hypothetical protein MLD38_018105 [Melastoma candidum]